MSLTSTNKASIRYKSGGHSFSAKEVESLTAQRKSVEIRVVTHKTVLMPAAHYDSQMGTQLLTSMGLTPSCTENVVATSEREGMVAVMAVDREFADGVAQLKGDVALTSPLLDAPVERGTIIELDGDVAFIRVYDGSLRFAEAVTIGSDAGLSYLAEKLNTLYSIYNMNAHARGDVERVKRVCGRCFKNLVE
jgi:hypothetical protein